MHRSIVTVSPVIGCLICFGLSASLAFGQSARAQSRSGKGNNTSVKQLDVRARQIQFEFVKNSTELARSYESAGELQKAKQVYSAIAKLNPDLKGVKEKIDELQEAILSRNASDFEVEAGAGWGPPRARVLKGKTLRIEAEGRYRLTLTKAELGPEGFPTADPPKADVAPGVPLGALAGVIVTKGKPGKPFVVGKQKEITPRNDGLLFLRVNVPEAAKCTGEVKVHLSGAYERF